MKQIFFFALLLIMGCQSSPDIRLGRAAPYLPKINLLKEGVVWKYYLHISPNANQPGYTDIRYRQMRINDNLLMVDDYNAGFEKIAHDVFRPQEEVWTLVKGEIIRNQDTIAFEITDNDFINWSGSEATTIRKTEMNGVLSVLENKQTTLQDTVINQRKSLVFSGKTKYQVYGEQDTTVYNYSWDQIWSDEIGMTSYQVVGDKVLNEWELDEIMTQKEFNFRKNHGLHRIAYIDTTSTLGTGGDFVICDDFDNIKDYYNDDIAQFSGGKRSLQHYIEKHLDYRLLEKESGYLTYRFVVNCQGNAGWFITEEADLNFLPKSFPAALRNHFYSLLSQVEYWKPLRINGKEQDAYTYITIKLQNGKIIEYLP